MHPLRYYLISALFFMPFMMQAQQLAEVTVKDTAYLAIIRDYIAESRLTSFIIDSLGIIVLRINELPNGREVDLAAIKVERASYFKQICIPSKYAYVDGRLVLFYDGLTAVLAYTDAYLADIDRVTEGRFQKMEEDRGSFVPRTVGPNGVVRKSRYVTAGNSNNGLTIYLYADGTRKRIRKI